LILDEAKVIYYRYLFLTCYLNVAVVVLDVAVVVLNVAVVVLDVDVVDVIFNVCCLISKQEIVRSTVRMEFLVAVRDMSKYRCLYWVVV
jgi:hypothetical protein